MYIYLQYNYDQQYYDQQYADGSDNQYDDAQHYTDNQESDPLASWREGAYGEAAGRGSRSMIRIQMHSLA